VTALREAVVEGVDPDQFHSFVRVSITTMRPTRSGHMFFRLATTVLGV
jgi:hypothetical protein